MIKPEKTSAMISSAAYMFAYAAQPCAHCRYQPRPGFHAQHLGDDQDGERIAETHKEPDEYMRHRRRNGDLENEETSACTQRTRDVVVATVHAGNA